MVAQPFIGMHRDTGQPISGREAIVQGIHDILTTRIGSRRMRPRYGSRLPEMVDLPFNGGLKSAMQAEIAEALNAPHNWSPLLTEPLMRVKRVTLRSIVDGRFDFTIDAEINREAVLIEVAL
ncbi:phage baseplate protein [Chitinimonas arctica]|uniref:Phage baseplate protein n=1 Tax=Chitinimonas arctica TaxID=2594795 RepID=A0A516SJB4_9NEIS|nr:GPW/gp25 family protein [Chitinimonas arctica]QDQ28245.1 phage baseplate protein [Chitinimonas arctica]